MNSAVSTIVLGVITWIICEAIKKCWDRSNKHDENVEPNHDKAYIIKQYYVSGGIALFFGWMLVNIDFNEACVSVFTVIISLAVFLNWCSFECMRDIADYIGNKLNNNDSDHNDD